MHFDLIQSLALAGCASVANDDRANTGDRLAWVIDGATDLGDPGLVGARGGAAWLAIEADAAFMAADDAPIDALCATVLARLAARFDAARTREPVARWELPVAAFLATRLAGGALEAAWLGDCVGLVRRADGVHRIGGAVHGKDAEAAHAASLAQHGLGYAKGRPAPVLDSLRAARARIGVEPRRWALGVEPEAAHHLRTDRVAVAPGDDLVLMTDGYAALIDSYGEYDDARLIAAIIAEGLAALALRLRAIEVADAACSRYPRFKTSDDATAIWLRITG